ncbi:TetR/AcrR family transcriptional regulator [Winogradskya consettensis]|uniref:TetR family transcriptional regulator n=2 Tax=Winogradskya TaxID=3240235 RepID=A0A919SVR8_9ACTN|nr:MULTISPECIES: TetR/AcrR family transcriptional regulator [Actinoplanes]GIE21947.1 TetR family transcriptional regulator [Actinoplanes humidus]GIM79372.1 TetR family transcriptional regulator [Actinoplanes consettensis]
MNATTGTRGGRGARERILAAAAELFYADGIHATGIARLTDVAHVSTRTFYQHFPSKNALVAAYLERFDAETPMPAEQELTRTDLAPRERLIQVFATLKTRGRRPVRGCPFHNAAVEAAGEMSEIAETVARHKDAFRQRLADTAAEAGIADAELLGRRLALLYEGATALSTSRNDGQAAADAYDLAKELIEGGR